MLTDSEMIDLMEAIQELGQARQKIEIIRKQAKKEPMKVRTELHEIEGYLELAASHGAKLIKEIQK